MTDAIKRQLVSDVPLCTFLSGGLDSSAITAVTAKGTNQLHTYSIDYEDNTKYFSESAFQPSRDEPWIRLIAERFQTIHHREVIDNDTLFVHLEAAVKARDIPGMADVDASLLWFSKRIKENFTVGLSGECADEIFGGYPWFFEEKQQGTFPWIRSLTYRENLLQKHWQKRLNLKDYAKDRYTEAIVASPHPDKQLFYINMTHFMASLLERKDRMSMAAGLEVRVPFADHRLVEYLWNVPEEMKRVNNEAKGLLRHAMRGILPEAILTRKKSPYPKTYHPVYTQMVQNKLQEILADKSSVLHGLFEKEKLLQLQDFKKPWFGQLMAGPQLIAYLIQLDFWVKEYGISMP